MGLLQLGNCFQLCTFKHCEWKFVLRVSQRLLNTVLTACFRFCSLGLRMPSRDFAYSIRIVTSMMFFIFSLLACPSSSSTSVFVTGRRIFVSLRQGALWCLFIV